MLNIKKFTKYGVILLVLTPVILAVTGTLLRSDDGVVSITAGVYFDTPLEVEIFQALSENSHINFVKYTNKDVLLSDVQHGNIDSGYIFSYNSEITLVTSVRTIAAPIINEIVAAAVLRATSEEITRQELRHFFGENSDIDYFTTWQFAAYNEMDIFMTPIFTGAAGASEPPGLTEITTQRVTRGIIGLMLHIFALFSVPIFISERQTAKALTLRGKLFAYDISLWLAAAFVMFVIGAVGLVSVGFFALHEFAAVAVLSVVCAAIMVFVGRFLKAAALIQSFGLFIIIANIIFGGVLLDLAEISQNLAYIQWVFPLFWYTSF